MSSFRADLIGRAALTRMSNLGGPPFNWDAATRTMTDFGKAHTKAELCQIVAYLAARVLAAEDAAA